MDADMELVDKVKACRTCGIHYVAPSKNQLKHLFQSCLEHSEIMLIRLELLQWKVEVSENDGFPQYVCNTCIHKFKQVFALRAACINAQNEFRKFYSVPNGNITNVRVKSEVPDLDEEQAICDFVYVDDLSDTEFDGATPFNFPHIPIKDEVIEAATIPSEESQQATSFVESAYKVVHNEPSSSHLSKLMSQNISVTGLNSGTMPQLEIEEIQCNLDQQLPSNQDDCTQHIPNSPESKNFECHICGKEFRNSTTARFKFHLKYHSLNKHLKCHLCGFLCNSKDGLRKHKRVSHRKLNCKICHKAVLEKKMKSHLRQHEILANYSCEYCTEVFDSEDRRETHIWQIHAIEDNNSNNDVVDIYQTICKSDIYKPQHHLSQEEILACVAQENMLYKFMCAHCEQRFVEQIDLEMHVNEQHRIICESADFVSKDIFKETDEINGNVPDCKKYPALNIFHDQENDNKNIATANNDCTRPLPENSMLPSTSFKFITINEQVDERETTAIDSSHKVRIDSGEEDERNVNFPSYVTNDINTFACAKCSQTFVSIEQLRQHYEQHLAMDQPQQIFKNKSQFNCDICDKSFNLKFNLNRHVKKHKNAHF